MREERANGFWLPLEKYSRMLKNVAATNSPTLFQNLQWGSLVANKTMLNNVICKKYLI
jgi:hypothetical protein